MRNGRFVTLAELAQQLQHTDERINRALARHAEKEQKPMTTTAIAERSALDASVVEQVLLGGDLSRLTPAQRLAYYQKVCDSLGLNPLTKPFDYLTLDGKLVLYARKDATEQLRTIRQLSVTIKAREVTEGVYVVTAGAIDPNNRTDESIGAVPIEGLKGTLRANAMMKAETKAKRRVTLSICGLGMLDESEIETIPGATVGEPPAPNQPPQLPEAWKPLAHEPDRIRGRVVDVKQVTQPGKKSGLDYTLTTVVLSSGEEVTTLDNSLATTAKDCLEDGSTVDVTTVRSGKRERDIKTIARIPAPGDPDVAM